MATLTLGVVAAFLQLKLRMPLSLDVGTAAVVKATQQLLLPPVLEVLLWPPNHENAPLKSDAEADWPARCRTTKRAWQERKRPTSID